MREELLFSWQGGPIILLQVRREYGVRALRGLFIFFNNLKYILVLLG